MTPRFGYLVLGWVAALAYWMGAGKDMAGSAVLDALIVGVTVALCWWALDAWPEMWRRRQERKQGATK